jgi:polyadenylate-binding protein
LIDHFSEFGKIISAKIEKFDNKSKGFAYIQFEKPEEAQAAIEKMNKQTINGKEIDVFILEKKSSRKQKFNNLFVKNLPSGIDDEKLKEMFIEFGEIESAVV